MIGAFLVGVIALNAPFRYLNSHCSSFETCFLSRVLEELHRVEFWGTLLAMWICGLLIVGSYSFRAFCPQFKYDNWTQRKAKQTYAGSREYKSDEDKPDKGKTG